MGDGYSCSKLIVTGSSFVHVPPESASRGTQMNQVVLKLVVT